jgi:transcriptional regulator with XRE-family HTH domain
MMKNHRIEDRHTLRRALVDARMKAGLTQRQLARRLGRAHSYVAKVEGGERRLDVNEFLELARALQFDPKHVIAELEAAYRQSPRQPQSCAAG